MSSKPIIFTQSVILQKKFPSLTYQTEPGLGPSGCSWGTWEDYLVQMAQAFVQAAETAGATSEHAPRPCTPLLRSGSEPQGQSQKQQEGRSATVSVDAHRFYLRLNTPGETL